jgi:hypothetical protein
MSEVQPSGESGRSPSDDSLRKARTTLRSLVSDSPSHLPSLNLIADDIRSELDKRGQVALLYVCLDRYGRLEPIFGWRVVRQILDAVAANLDGMTGSSLRRLDVVSDFTLTDDAYIVLLSPPRSAQSIAPDDLAAVTRRVYERLQSLLLNDLAPGVYDRVHPSVGAAILQSDDELTFEQNLQQGVAMAMQAAAQQAAVFDAELEQTLADCCEHGELEPLFEPIVDPRGAIVLGYRSSVRGPFYSPLRLPDVLLDVARRSSLLASYGIAAREATVSAAAGLRPDDLLFLGCAAAELPNAAVVAVSDFYSFNHTLVPQHVVFEIDADDLGSTRRPPCARSPTCGAWASSSVSQASVRSSLRSSSSPRQVRSSSAWTPCSSETSAAISPHWRSSSCWCASPGGAAHSSSPRAYAMRSSSTCFSATVLSCSAASSTRAQTRGCRP